MNSALRHRKQRYIKKRDAAWLRRVFFPDWRLGSLQSGSSFTESEEPLYSFVLAAFRAQNRFTLLLEML